MNSQKGESALNNDNKPDDKTQDLLTTKQAAEFLGVSRKTIQRYRRDGILNPEAFGENNSALYSTNQLVKVVKRLLEGGTDKLNSEGSTGTDKLLKFRPEVRTSYQRLVTRSTALTPVQADFSRPDADCQVRTSSTAKMLQVRTSSTKITTNSKGSKSSKTVYVVEDAETLIKNSPFITPSTYYSPKDKVSNLLWANEIPHDVYWGVITVFKNEDYGCIVRLNYDKIFEEENIITGADFSAFDRIVYDAVVTLYVTKNNIFSTTALWRIITQNPHAKITDEIRIKIAKSMFHISNFLMSIITDHNEKPSAWHELNSNPNDPPFKAENRFYRKVQSLYGGRLLEFRWLAERFVTITRTVDGKEIKEMRGIPEVWNILATPLLYQYAASKSQVVSVPLPSLNLSDKADKKTTLKRSNHTNELTNFLTREIDTMKKRSSYSHIILLERIYSIDGINEVQQSENSLKKKRYLTRNKLEKILRRFKENGLIQGYTFHKKIIGRISSFFSVELWMPSG